MTGVLRGHCDGCGHIWVVAYLPMEISKVAALGRRAACPMCAGTKVFVATSADRSSGLCPTNPPKSSRN